MLKKPSATFFRIWLPLIAASFALNLWISSASFRRTLVFVYSCPSAFRAIAWHRHHGNTVAYDGHVFHLPTYWYPDPESHPNKLMLREAHFGSLGLNDVIFRTMPQKLDEKTAQEEIANKAVQFNQHSQASDQWTVETLQGRSLAFHCMMSSNDGSLETLICQAADSNLDVFISTAGRRARSEALNILETSE